MTRRSLKDVKALLLGWAKKSPEIFDQPNNEMLTRHYIYDFCGLKGQIVSDSRIANWPLETIFRGSRLLVAEGQINMSEENKRIRHIKELAIIEEIKQEKGPINYDDLFIFTPDGRAIPKI